MIYLIVATLVFFTAEAYVVLLVGERIGLLASLGLTLATGIAGLIVVRIQGLRTVLQAQRDLQSGKMPVASAIHGVGLVVAGVCLFLPGFLTDLIGIALLFPPVRLWLGRRALAALQSRMTVVVQRGSAAAPDGVVDLETDMWHDTTSAHGSAEAPRLRGTGDHGSQRAQPPHTSKDNRQR